MSTGFRPGLRPPTAHKPQPIAMCVMIQCYSLRLKVCPLVPGALHMFRGFRCRPHLRV
jgi:hypothetical protein